MELEQNTGGRPPNSLHFIVGQMNGKLDQLIYALAPQFKALSEADEALEGRVLALENTSQRVIGAGVVVVFLVGAWEVVRYVILG